MFTFEKFSCPDGITPNSGLNGPNKNIYIYIYIYMRQEIGRFTLFSIESKMV